MIDTAARLTELTTLAQEPEDPRFSPHFEAQIISRLLDEDILSSSIERELQHLEPDYFNDHWHGVILADIKTYHKKFGKVPTRSLLKRIIGQHITEDDPHERIVQVIQTPVDPREVPFIDDYLKDWIKRCISQQMRLSDDPLPYMDRLKALEGKAETAFDFQPLNQLLANRKPPTWLIEGVMTANQPFMIAGPKKCLKTALLCDMAISLATGDSFLGQFKVPTPVSVGFISAESGDDELLDRCNDICKSKNIRPDELANIHISFQCPKLSLEEDLAGIGLFIKENRIKALIIDPVYLTLLGGDGGATKSGDLMGMGPKYQQVAAACIKNGATPILAHHNKKGSSKDGDLDNMSQSGAAEFSRQSILLERRNAYNGVEQNELTIWTHGYKRGSRYDLDINELTWAVTLKNAPSVALRKESIRDARRKQLVLEAMREAGEPMNKKAINTASGVNGENLIDILTKLQNEGAVRMVIDGKKVLYRVA